MTIVRLQTLHAGAIAGMVDTLTALAMFLSDSYVLLLACVFARKNTKLRSSHRSGRGAVSANISVDYNLPIPVGTDVLIEARYQAFLGKTLQE